MSRLHQRTADAIEFFRVAEAQVIAAGFACEIDWQRHQVARPFSERELLKEAAWVILCSGFRETVVRKHFSYISLCFCDWESAEVIERHRVRCVSTATACFSHQKKLEAIASIAGFITRIGFSTVQCAILEDPIRQLERFPFIGPVTAWHLAKNLGIDVAKNDRHLARVAKRLGYRDAQSLCGDVALVTGEPISVIDIVLWRFAVLNPSASDCKARTVEHSPQPQANK